MTFVSGFPYNSDIFKRREYKMPNWVFNGLTVEGNPESVKKMRDQLNKPFTKMHEQWDIKTNEMKMERALYPNPVFAFHNIYSHLDAGITDEEYVKQPKRSALEVKDPDWWSDTQKLASKDNSWYSFNNREWGTKWDVAVSSDDKYPETNMEEAENGENYVVHYNFQTAWGIPLPAIEKLSAQYPDLLFTLSYEEETGWGGEMEFLRGVVISQSEYETKCRECDNTDCLIYDDEKGVEICQKCGYES